MDRGGRMPIEGTPARCAGRPPREVVFPDEMPVNPTGKLDREGLKRMAEEHLHPHGLPT